jgi:hypothetical protein
MQSTALILDEIGIGRATHFITLRRWRRQRPLGGTPQLLWDTLQRGGALLAVPTRVPGHCPLSPTGINSSVSHHPILNSTWNRVAQFRVNDPINCARSVRRGNRIESMHDLALYSDCHWREAASYESCVASVASSALV